MKEIKIKIKPLSVNAAWQGRRYKTDKYKCYEKDIFLLVKENTETISRTGLYQVEYNFYLSNWMRTDGDNLVKCLQDILVKLKYIKDDRYIMRYLINKYLSKENYSIVRISEYTYCPSEK